MDGVSFSDKFHKVLSNGFKIYPVIKEFKQAVCVEDTRKIIYKKKNVSSYEYTTKNINKALIEKVNEIYIKVTNS